MYDVLIIGAGPAGMTAGIFASRREMKTLIISKNVGGQLIWAADIENYPGFKNIQSFDLINNMKEQALCCGVEFKEDEIQNIKREENKFIVFTNKEKIEARTIIISMGLSPKRLAIPGEEEFSGRGVSYCANCDGPFYKNKIVAVIGGGNSALDAAEVLSKIATKVYLINKNEEFKGFEKLVNEVKDRENITIINNSEIKGIFGESSLKNISIINNKNNEEQTLDINGLFIEIGRSAATDLVGELVERNNKDQIIINEKCETKTPGIFAAGDVTAGEFKQITIACGQGTIAALAAYQYLQLGKSPNIWVK